MASQNRTHASDRGKAVVDIPGIPTIGTATAGPESATVAFTENVRGGAATTWTALSNPGSITGTGSSSPVTVTGLTAGTAYTFTVRGANATGNGEYSAASNSIVPSVATSYESIATQVVGAGGAASVTFSSIPGTFKHLQIRGISRCTKADTGSENVVMSFNGDTNFSNYRTHLLEGDGSTTYAGVVQTDGFYSQAALTIGNNATANVYGPTVIDILDYTNTNKNTTVRLLTGIDTNGYGQIRFASSLWLNTAAITSITINPRSAGNFSQFSHFALYGIRG